MSSLVRALTAAREQQKRHGRQYVEDESHVLCAECHGVFLRCPDRVAADLVVAALEATQERGQQRVWKCARCGLAPEQHHIGMEAQSCVYDPVLAIPIKDTDDA